jgi:hypothetical protein
LKKNVEIHRKNGVEEENHEAYPGFYQTNKTYMYTGKVLMFQEGEGNLRLKKNQGNRSSAALIVVVVTT